MRRALLVSIAVGALAFAAPAGAVTLEPIAPEASFQDPTYVTSDPSDANRLFVTEQGGELILVEGGVLSTVLDLDELGLLCDPCDNEEGLLSAALPDDFAATGHLYLYYTRNDGDNQVDEFTLDAGEPERRAVLEIPHPTHTNHNSGQLQFGPDGLLYISVGDGGGQGDVDDDAQDLGNLLGKILRIDPRQSGGDAYTVPDSNPFFGEPGAKPEIWSYGLRNPWRFSFDAVTGDLLIGDVGQNAWEEVDFDPAPNSGRGINFGWDCFEGPEPFTGPPDAPSPACTGSLTLTDPIFAYPHGPSGPDSITGGYVVRDPALGDLYGRYLYANYYAGHVRSIVPELPSASESDRSEGVTAGGLSSFGQDSAGCIYVVSQGTGSVYRLVGDQPSACVAAAGDGGGSLPSCRGETATIVASPGVETTGTAARDVIVGAAGADEIRTGPGKDLVCARGGADEIRTGGGKDFAKGGGGKDFAKGGGGNDRLRGGGGKDRLRGGGGRDRLRGGGGRDRLRGGGGNDRCTGGPGHDREQSC